MTFLTPGERVSQTRMQQIPPPVWGGIGRWASAVLHTAALAVLVLVPASRELISSHRQTVTHLTAPELRPVKAIPVRRSAPRLVLPARPVLLPIPAATTPVLIAPPPAAVAVSIPERAPIVAAPATAVPPPPSISIAPAETRPAVQTGVFAATPTPPPSRIVAEPAAVRTGEFNAASTARATASAGTISTGAFGRTESFRGGTVAVAQVSTGSFGSASSGPGTAARGATPVLVAGFDRPTAQAAAQPRESTVKSIPDRRLEILVKPRPRYTEEGRKRQIEGEVVLEAEFQATGSVRVIRVLQGLGHGLDQAAIEAAQAIRFRPAEQHGQPVSVVAQVHLAFQLAY